MALFNKKPEARVVRRSALVNVIAKSDLDFALLREAVFLLNYGSHIPTEKRVVGQHRVEENGSPIAVVPVHDEVPRIPFALAVEAYAIEGHPEGFDFQALRNSLKELRADVKFGVVRVV